MVVLHSEHTTEVSQLRSELDVTKAAAKTELQSEASALQSTARVWETRLNCQMVEAVEHLQAARERDAALRSEFSSHTGLVREEQHQDLLNAESRADHRLREILADAETSFDDKFASSMQQ